MSPTNNHTFLTEELRRALASTDQQGEVNLVFLHYYQGALAAHHVFQPCTDCTRKVGDTFKAQAAQIQQTTYHNYHELEQLCETQLPSVILLCTACQEGIEQEIFRQFRQRRQQREP